MIGPVTAWQLAPQPGGLRRLLLDQVRRVEISVVSPRAQGFSVQPAKTCQMRRQNRRAVVDSISTRSTVLGLVLCVALWHHLSDSCTRNAFVWKSRSNRDHTISKRSCFLLCASFNVWSEIWRLRHQRSLCIQSWVSPRNKFIL